jgi:biopolymer transport protein ExbD
MSLGEHQKKSATPYINVTPLIDVLLVLLIIFMVISPAKPNRFDARIPEKPSPTSAPDPVCDLCLVVSVLPGGASYKLNAQEAATLAELNAQLHEALDGRPADRRAVFLKAPPALAYGEVVKVIDVMKEAGSFPIGLQLENLNQ